MRQTGGNWGGRIGALALVLSVAGVAEARAGAELIYGGQVNAAGMPVTREGGNDPGGLQGSTALAAQSEKLDLQRTYGGVRLSDALTVEAAHTLSLGDATRQDQQTLSLSGKATLPLSDALSISGKLGLRYSGATAPCSAPALMDPSGLSPLYGLGFAYAPAKGVELRVESEHTPRAAGGKTVAGDNVLLGARITF